MLNEYYKIFLFFIVASFIAIIALSLPVILKKSIYKKDKLLPYECGFDSFDNSSSKFNIRFYLTAILFIVFDIEIVYLIAWSINLGRISWLGFWSMMFFIFLLIVGFFYEWKKGALEWE